MFNDEDILITLYQTCVVLSWINSIFLLLLVIVSCLIIKRNKHKLVPIMLIFFILAIVTKLLYFLKSAQVYKSYFAVEFTQFQSTMLFQLPILFFMMASILNLNYWITFYL